MLLEGCQGKKGPELLEVVCPDCGESVEMLSTDLIFECDSCGRQIFNDGFSCAFRCPEAEKCVGEKEYARLLSNREKWIAQIRAQVNDDEW